MASSSSSYLAIQSTILLFLLVLFGWHDEAAAQCLEHQKSLLVKLNQSLTLYNNGVGYRGRILKWDLNNDCCGWPGVACNYNGYVIGLDLSYERIVQGLNNSSPLFQLQHLTALNLVGNEFQWTRDMSSGFERLVNLMNLNMSFSNFFGRFPAEISNLTRLVTLDLSNTFYYESPSPINLRVLVGNLTKLSELHLDYVYHMGLGMQGSEWSKIMSSSLPHLQVLSLKGCGLSGLIDDSFQNLTLLSVLDLSINYFNIPFPIVFSKFKYLTSLSLAECGFSGEIPYTLGELTLLSRLDLSENSFEGSILNTNWGGLTKLKHLDVGYNSLTGSIPSSLFGIPALVWLDVSHNHFVNFTNEQVSTSLSRLEVFILNHNDLHGPFPSVIFGLQALQALGLRFNNFSGTFYMNSLQQLMNLSSLDISYNNFSVEFGEDLHPFPSLTELGMASCILKAFPKFLNRNTKIDALDLSANQIQGEIPRWIWDILKFPSYLNLSHNHLQTFEAQVSYCDALIVDLSHNNLHGNIPIFLNVEVLDLSGNSFDSIPLSTLNISSLLSLSMSNNFLRGSIPKSLCNARLLQVLDLSNNFLSGTLPSCLLQIENLRHLNLKNNSIGGTIPDSFPMNCLLTTVNLNSNALQGTFPKSLEKCKRLKLLDLGNNKILDRLPCWMSNSSSLEILVLRSNMLQGSIVCPFVNVTWPSLQILDIASNNFSGKLPSRQLLSWKAMVNDSTSQHIISRRNIYLPELIVQVVLKGTVVALSKIFIRFTLIDLSNNMFEGNIPDELGYFIALHTLNISYNNLRGRIPSMLGTMKNLETLDLQNNELSGTIPVQLANLNFLSILNLSYNQLEGKIPNGGQLGTFSEDSFLHNEGLCGLPFDTSCDKKDEIRPVLKQSSKFEGEILISAEVGYAVGLGFIIMPLIFWPGWRMRFFEFTNRVLIKILCR